MNQIDQAFDAFQKALSFANQLNDKLLIAYSLNNLGIAYKVYGQYDKALGFYKQSLDLKKEFGDERTIANSLGNIGEIYLLKQDYETARKYFGEVDEISKKSKDKYTITVNLINYGKIYRETNNYSSAFDSYNKALDIALSSQFNELVKDIYFELSLLYENSGNQKLALSHYKKYTEIKDSLVNEKKNRLIVQMDAAFQLEKAQKENEMLRYKSNLDQTVLDNNKTFSTHLIGFLILLFIALFFIFMKLKDYSKRKKLVQEKNYEIEKANEELRTLNNELEKHVTDRTYALTHEIAKKEEMLVTLHAALKETEQANKLKDAFLSNINHEIRTPLSAIIGLTEVLKGKITTPEYQNYLDGISQSSNRLHSLLNNIIDFSRLQANDLTMSFTSCNINNIVTNAVDLFKFKANEKNLSIELFLGNVPGAHADITFLSKVVSDIIDNAVKYTSKGGVEIHTGSVNNSKDIYIKIIDTGIGIDETFISQIFDGFSQESSGYARLYEGAGLGLPLARRLINMMNGRLELSSKKGNGTTVTLFLTAEKDHIERVAVQGEKFEVAEKEINPEKYSCLIIEDDPFNALFISAILEGMTKITIAEKGDEALHIITEKYKSEERVFDIIIIDINLPNDWNGVSLMKKIKEDFQKYLAVPFIAQTAYSLNSEQYHLDDAGFNETIVKPIDSVKLKNVVKRYLLKNK
jgi:signal transduction histidine kinase/CheY-like chemotaxis protein